jgi:hypothetical protein
MGSAARTAAVILSVILAVIAESYSQEWTSSGNEFLVSRHFSRIVITGRDAVAARLFIDPIRNVPTDEAQQLRQLVVASLSDKVRMADSKADANYWLQILSQNHKFPIKNPNNEPALGSVLFSICKCPIKEVTLDCENLTYFYFVSSARVDLFERVLALWMGAVFPPAVK